MAKHSARVVWERATEDFEIKTYNRDHRWEFPGGESVNASSAPGFLGNADYVDPEEALAASLSSCHMLTFLYVAAKAGYTVDRYVDDAQCETGRNEEGRFAVVRAVLNPKIEFSGDAPAADELATMHEQAHRDCFIANTVKCPVDVL